MRNTFKGRKRYALVGTVVAVVAGLLSAPSPGSAQAAGSWPTFHGGASRDGTLGISGPMTSTIVVRYPLGSTTGVGISDSPVVDSHGVAYVADNKGTVYALDPAAHTVKWQTASATGQPVVDSPGLSPDGGSVYVGSNDGNLYALNTSNGAIAWQLSLGAPVISSPIVSADGSTIYTATNNGTVYAVSSSSHNVSWKYNLPGALAGSITLGQNGSVLYAASGWFIYPIPSTGPSTTSNLGVYYLTGAAAGSPAVDTNGNIYVGTVGGTLDAFQPGTPAPKWTFHDAGNAPITTTPAISSGGIIVGAENNYVYSVNPSSGLQTWQQVTGGPVDSSPVIATGNSMVYVGSSDGKLYAFNIAGGSPVWTSTMGTSVSAAPALSPDGSVWAVTRTGDVSDFNKLSNPPGPTAGPTNTPGPTSTPGPTNTPGPTATPTVPPVSISAKASGGTPGKTVTLTAVTAPNQTVHFLVTYPNGDHHSQSASSGTSGSARAKFKQPASKITHNNFTATVTARVTVNGLTSTASTQYRIKFAAIDLSVEPRSQAAGAYVDIYLHTKSRTRTVVAISFPNHTVQHKHGTTNSKGWMHWKYKVPKGRTTSSSTSVHLRGSTLNRHPNVTTITSFKVT